MSTQDRAVRGEEAAQSEGLDGEANATASGQIDPTRLRAMQRRWIQRKASGGSGGAAAAIPGGAGAPLGGGVQARMEKTLGADLSGVRVHTGGDSAQAAESLGARAFTVGGDVHFGHGEFAPGSKEGDRLLAHELTHVVQGQKSGVQRKAAPAEGEGAEHGDAAHGDHEAGGHEVSEPGDPAEHEADAMGDHAAEELHGGGDKGGAEHGGGDKGGGKKVAREEKPTVGAAAPSVGRKIFRAKNPAAPDKAAKGGGKGAAPPPGQKQQPQGLSPADQQKVQRIKASISGKPDPMMVSTLKLYTDDVTRLTTGDQAKDPGVLELKTAYDAKWAEVFQSFDDTINGAVAGYGAIKKDEPGAYDAFKAVGKSADLWSLTGLQKEFRDRPSMQKYLQTKTTVEKEIFNSVDHVLMKAVKDMGALPAEGDPAKPHEDPTAKAEAIFEAARPWFNKVPGAAIVQQALQNAYVSKREAIATAHAKQKEKELQEKAAAKTAGAEGRGAGSGHGKPGDAAGATGASASAHAPPQATGAPAPAGAAKPAQQPATAATATPAKPPVQPAPQAQHAPAPQAHAPAPQAQAAPASATADAHPAPAGAPAAHEHGNKEEHAPQATPAAAPTAAAAPTTAHGPAPEGHAPPGGHGDKEGEKDAEVAKLTEEQQALVDVINGLAAQFGTKSTKASSWVSRVSTTLGVVSSLTGFPMIAGAIGLASFGINKYIDGDKKKLMEKAHGIAELVPLLKDPAKVQEVLSLYQMGVTDLQALEEFLTAKIQEQQPALVEAKETMHGKGAAKAPEESEHHGKGAAKAPEEKHAAASTSTAPHGARAAEDEDEAPQGDHHGGAAHVLHKVEKIGHVLHASAELAEPFVHVIEHMAKALPVVGVGILGLKEFLNDKEITELQEKLEKKKEVDEKLAALTGKGGPAPAGGSGGTPPAGHH